MKDMEKPKKVFICSPFRGIAATPEAANENYQKNIAIAKGACRLATALGFVPYCPHLYFPRFLLDSSPDEREMGIRMGQSWLEQCDELWVIGRRTSEGMKREIARAKELGIPEAYYVLRRTPEERLLDAIFHPGVEFREVVW
jgi:hypothetical protein